MATPRTASVPPRSPRGQEMLTIEQAITALSPPDGPRVAHPYTLRRRAERGLIPGAVKARGEGAGTRWLIPARTVRDVLRPRYGAGPQQRGLRLMGGPRGGRPLHINQTLAGDLARALAGTPPDAVPAALQAIIPHLTARQAAVLTLRLGLGGHPPISQVEVGARLGITRARAHQLETAALHWLAASGWLAQSSVPASLTRRAS